MRSKRKPTANLWQPQCSSALPTRDLRKCGVGKTREPLEVRPGFDRFEPREKLRDCFEGQTESRHTWGTNFCRESSKAACNILDLVIEITDVHAFDHCADIGRPTIASVLRPEFVKGCHPCDERVWGLSDARFSCGAEAAA